MGKINDRGLMKWQGFFMTEHVKLLKEYENDELKRVVKPELDLQQIEEINFLLMEAMEYNNMLSFSYYRGGHIYSCEGFVHYIDHIKKEIRLVDFQDIVHKLKFNELVDVKTI